MFSEERLLFGTRERHSRADFSIEQLVIEDAFFEHNSCGIIRKMSSCIRQFLYVGSVLAILGLLEVVVSRYKFSGSCLSRHVFVVTSRSVVEDGVSSSSVNKNDKVKNLKAGSVDVPGGGQHSESVRVVPPRRHAAGDRLRQDTLATSHVLPAEFFVEADAEFRDRLSPHLVSAGSDYGGWTYVAGALLSREQPSAESQSAVVVHQENGGRSPFAPLVYSVGLGEDISWDLSLIKRFPGMRVFGYDPTDKAREYVKSLYDSGELTSEQYKYKEEGLALEAGVVEFALPEKGVSMWAVGLGVRNVEGAGGKFDVSEKARSTAEGGSGKSVVSKPVNTLEHWMWENGHDTLDILKIDVEGLEYDLLEAWIGRAFFPFRQLLVEFHARFDRGKLAVRERKVVEGLQAAGFSVLWHKGQEWCFVNRRRELEGVSSSSSESAGSADDSAGIASMGKSGETSAKETATEKQRISGKTDGVVVSNGARSSDNSSSRGVIGICFPGHLRAFVYPEIRQRMLDLFIRPLSRGFDFVTFWFLDLGDEQREILRIKGFESIGTASSNNAVEQHLQAILDPFNAVSAHVVMASGKTNEHESSNSNEKIHPITTLVGEPSDLPASAGDAGRSGKSFTKCQHPPSRFREQWERVSLCESMFRAYEKRTGKTLDFVVRARTDLLFFSKLNHEVFAGGGASDSAGFPLPSGDSLLIPANITLNQQVFAADGGLTGINDHIGICAGKSKKCRDAYFRALDLCLEAWTADDEFLPRTLAHQGVKIQEETMVYAIMRPCLGLGEKKDLGVANKVACRRAHGSRPMECDCHQRLKTLGDRLWEAGAKVAVQASNGSVVQVSSEKELRRAACDGVMLDICRKHMGGSGF